MNTPTVGDLYEFIMKYKGNKVFTEYTPAQIVTLIYEGIHNKTLCYSLDDNGTINGMILAEVRPTSKILFIVENLAMSLENLKRFAARAKKQYPGYKLEGYKHGKIRNYDNFLKRITK